jgi:hypothetical protein
MRAGVNNMNISLCPSTELLDLCALLFKDFHAHGSDASHSSYGGPSTAYLSGHSFHDMESPAGFPAAYCDIEIEIEINMYRMRRFTTSTVCAGCCLWALPTMPYMNLTSQG